MRFSSILFIALGFASGLALAIYGLYKLGEIDFLTNVQAFGSLAIAFSALVAFSVYLATDRRGRKEDERRASATYMREALSLLDTAYETFTRAGTNPPANDRLLWLSTARMIVRFQNLCEKVTEPDHVAVLEENEESARLRFYVLLEENLAGFTREYFCSGEHQYSGENVSRKSIAVIFSFSKWRESIQDPLDNIDDIDLIAGGAIPIVQDGVRAYLEDFPEYWAQVEERRAANNDNDP